MGEERIFSLRFWILFIIFVFGNEYLLLDEELILFIGSTLILYMTGKYLLYLMNKFVEYRNLHLFYLFNDLLLHNILLTCNLYKLVQEGLFLLSLDYFKRYLLIYLYDIYHYQVLILQRNFSIFLSNWFVFQLLRKLSKLYIYKIVSSLPEKLGYFLINKLDKRFLFFFKLIQFNGSFILNKYLLYYLVVLFKLNYKHNTLFYFKNDQYKQLSFVKITDCVYYWCVFLK